MSKPRTAVLVAAAVALAFAGGWLARSTRALPAITPPARSLPALESAQLEGVAGELREILMRPDPIRRAEGVASLLSRLGPESLDAVRTAYDSVFLDVGDIELVLLAEWWAAFDPEAAYGWALMSWRVDHPMVRNAVLRAWGRTDPPAALLRASAAPSLRAEYVRAVLTGWDESGKPGLYEMVRSMPPNLERQRLIEVISRRRVLRDGLEATFRWAEALPDDEDDFKLHVFQRVASSAAEIDPERAAGWASQHAGRDYAWDLARRVGTRWAKREPAKAMAWVASLPPSRGRDVAVRETYLAWVRTDLAAALAYVENAQLEPWLDPAVAVYTKMIVVNDPGRSQEALGWVARISSPELRDATTILIARSWLLEDPAAAEAWLAQADVPDLVRQKIHEIPKRARKLAEERRAASAARAAAPAPDQVPRLDPWGPPLPE
jgi:hypothetical protein